VPTDSTTVETVFSVVRDWFAAVRLASLELPSGWFGRPYDNLHRLTWLAHRGDKVIMELDDRLHLIITGPAEVDANADELRIVGFARATFDWQEYGSVPRSHAETFVDGQIRLVAQGA
jgi:hypothetical protein